MRSFCSLVVAVALIVIGGCNNKVVQVDLPKEPPKAQMSDYGMALVKLGRMTKILRTQPVKVQTVGVVDDTGVSQATGGEIPFDVTGMIKSAVNRIGGKVTFVPYDPVFLKNQAALKFTSLRNKTRPDVVLHGGITEYDRALEVTNNSADFGGDFGGGKNALGIDAGTSAAGAVSRITLDMNMMDFETMAMIPQVQAVNSIRVFKGMNEAELGFSIMGASFGLSGSVKKVQGHHAAVRTLIDLSVLEVIGKYLNIPYWKCVGLDIPADPLVIERIKEQYAAASKQRKILMIQKFLRVYGVSLSLNGKLDDNTVNALYAYKDAYDVKTETLDADFYAQLFRDTPVFEKSRIKQKTVAQQPVSLVAKEQSTAMQSLQVQVQAFKKKYYKDEAIQIQFEGNQDFYGKLFYVMADGGVVQLLPNKLRMDMRFSGGKTYTVPNHDDSFALNVAPPLGVEKIVLFASPEPLQEIPMQTTPDGLGYFDKPLADIAKMLHSKSSQLTISTWTIETMP